MIHHDMPMREYLDEPGYSSHALKLGWLRHDMFSAAHLKAGLDAEKAPANDAMRLGTATHTIILEPEKALETIVVMPDYASKVRNKDGSVPQNPRMTGEYKRLVADFEAANPGKVILDAEQYDNMQAMARAVRRHRAAMDALAEASSEVSIFWTDPVTQLWCKRRPDKRGIELKTTAKIAQFETDAINYGYDIQAAMATDAWLAHGHEVEEHWLVVESVPPYTVHFAPISTRVLRFGRERYRRALKAIRDGLDTGEWPGPPDPEQWQLPAWVNPPMPKFGSGR